AGRLRDALLLACASGAMKKAAIAPMPIANDKANSLRAWCGMATVDFVRGCSRFLTAKDTIKAHYKLLSLFQQTSKWLETACFAQLYENLQINLSSRRRLY